LLEGDRHIVSVPEVRGGNKNGVGLDPGAGGFLEGGKLPGHRHADLPAALGANRCVPRNEAWADSFEFVRSGCRLARVTQLLTRRAG
jgi:hypothetical protein